MLSPNRKAGIIKGAPRAKSGKMQVVVKYFLVLPTEVLLRILLTSLVSISFLSPRCSQAQKRTTETYLRRLADLLADGLPLVGVVLFDRSKQRSALLTH
jgi:hypothetical protein